MRGDGIDYDSILDPHEIAGLLLQFLYQLPDPVIPFDLHDSFVAVTRKHCAAASVEGVG